MKLFFCGDTGKTGHVIVEFLRLQPDIEILGVVNRQTRPLFEQVNEMKGNVVIDFTTPLVAYQHGLTALQNGLHFICGTTGLLDVHIEALKKVANENHLSCLICPNFACGIGLIKQMIPLLEPHYPHVRISETHHHSKRDVPSGTALQLRSLFPYPTQVPIQSFRTEYATMEHVLTFASAYETIAITHTVRDRKIYAEGVYKALKKVGTWEGLRFDCID